MADVKAYYMVDNMYTSSSSRWGEVDQKQNGRTAEP